MVWHIKINSFFSIYEDKIFEIEHRYKSIIEHMNRQAVDLDLTAVFGQRLEKYKYRIAKENKIQIKKIKKIEKQYMEFLKSIVDYFNKMDWDITIEDLKNVHKLFFPKGILWETRDNNGNVGFNYYKAWVFRKANEFAIVNWEYYEYLKPEHIESSIEKLLDFINSKKEKRFFDIIIFYIILWEIHPFYNWNWTMQLLFSSYLLKKDWYNFNLVDFYNKLSPIEALRFFKSWAIWDYDNVIKKITQSCDSCILMSPTMKK